MLEPKREWRKFKNEEEKEKIFRVWGFPLTRDICYKGLRTEEEVVCEVLGFLENKEEKEEGPMIAVILLENKLHTIHSAYLSEMQSKNFKR